MPVNQLSTYRGAAVGLAAWAVIFLHITPGDCGWAAEASGALKSTTQRTLHSADPILPTPTPEAGQVPPLTWRAEWRGWDGIHFDLTRRTLLGDWLPGVTQLPPLVPHLWTGEHREISHYQPELARVRLAGKLGAKVAVDAAAYNTSTELEDFEPGVELRRARVYARGDCLLVLPVSYELEIGYVANEFYIENSYLAFRDIGFLGTLKAGQYHVPMTLENIGSSRDMMFMESASPLQALGPGVEAGFQVGRPILGQRMTWALGLFADGVGDDFGDATKDFGRAVARITGLPIDEPGFAGADRPRLLHLGLSGYGLYAGASSVRYRSRPESHLAPYVIDTGEVDADGAVVLGGEAAWVDGPLCVQGEYLHSWVRENSGRDVSFSGFYISASWFLTGDSRPYNRAEGIFSRVIPRRKLAPKQGGWGAWEVAGRFSHVDLNAEDVSGGRLSMGMAGLNWYLHSHLKWRIDYGVGRASGGSSTGTLRLIQTRLEIDF